MNKDPGGTVNGLYEEFIYDFRVVINDCISKFYIYQNNYYISLFIFGTIFFLVS